MGTLHDVMSEVLPVNELNAFIDETIRYTETNEELSFIGATLLLRALDVLSTTCPHDQLKASIIQEIDDRAGRYIRELKLDLPPDQKRG